MELLIVRHGPAGDRESWHATGRPDTERPLTKDGRRKARAAAAALAHVIDGVELVATSSWTRAAQTAAQIRDSRPPVCFPTSVDALDTPHEFATFRDGVVEGSELECTA
jgi:phosphohistidine phosphatase SixA